MIVRKLSIGLITLGIFFVVGYLAPADAVYESYVDNLPQPVAITSQTTEIQQRLNKHIQEMVSLGHLAPTFYFRGSGAYPNLGGPNIFYFTPSETIYALSIAYPYVSESLKPQLKEYLDNELSRYPPHLQAGFNWNWGPKKVSEMEGKRREYFPPNPNLQINVWPPVEIHLSVLYSIWAYSYYTNDWVYANNNYQALKNIFINWVSTHSRVSSYPELAGVIGFARIAKKIGEKASADYQAALALAEQGFNDGVNFEQFLRTAEANYPKGEHLGYFTPIFLFHRQPIAVHFNRDIGRFLKDHALSQVNTYAQGVNNRVPLWWLTAAAFSQGENSYTTPELSWTHFMLRAYVLAEPTEQLKKYLDAPDRKGDLLYIQKLVAVLESVSAAGPATPTISRLLGDINLDMKVDGQDAKILLSLYKTNFWPAIYAPDPDKDGQVTSNDFGYVIRDWGK